jgi:restriction endonuclease
LINYLTALQVNKSVYEYVQYDSEVEREFAKRLDEREDIKLFVKLPGWFVIDTPVGTYNPDWAILKHDGQAPQDLYQQIVTWAEEMKVDASLLKAITGAAAAPPADYVHHQG